jgi:hypothetical protein
VQGDGEFAGGGQWLKMGNVNVTGGPLPGNGVSIEFKGDLALQDIVELIPDGTGLTGDGDEDAVITTLPQGAGISAGGDYIGNCPRHTLPVNAYARNKAAIKTNVLERGQHAKKLAKTQINATHQVAPRPVTQRTLPAIDTQSRLDCFGRVLVISQLLTHSVKREK